MFVNITIRSLECTATGFYRYVGHLQPNISCSCDLFYVIYWPEDGLYVPKHVAIYCKDITAILINICVDGNYHTNL
jgi:hypothetical protein